MLEISGPLVLPVALLWTLSLPFLKSRAQKRVQGSGQSLCPAGRGVIHPCSHLHPPAEALFWR